MAEKTIVSGEEDQLIVVIPPIVRLRIVRVELQPVIISIEVEHVQVAIAIGCVCSAIRTTVRLIHNV